MILVVLLPYWQIRPIRYYYLIQVHSSNCTHIRNDRSKSRTPDCCDPCFKLFKMGQIATRIKAKMLPFLNVIVSLSKRDYEAPEKTIFGKFIKTSDENLNEDGKLLKAEVKAALDFIHATKAIALKKSSLASFPSDILGLSSLTALEGKSFTDGHVFAMTRWCIARIKNPREPVPDAIKSIMMLISDISPKACSIFGSNFGGVNDRTKARWIKERKSTSTFGLSILDLRTESLEKSLSNIIQPLAMLVDGALKFSICYDETVVPEQLDTSSFGAILGQCFPAHCIVSSDTDWKSLQSVRH